MVGDLLGGVILIKAGGLLEEVVEAGLLALARAAVLADREVMLLHGRKLQVILVC